MLALSTAVWPSRLGAQDSTATPVDTLVADTIHPAMLDTVATSLPDSARRPVRPFGAFWRSLLVPGWGQLKVGRKMTAGLFVITEGITVGMSIKANRDLGYLRRIGADSASIAAKVRTREDWYVLLAVNHLLAGLEAFIAAQLLDFPAELHVERTPGRIDAGVSVPLHLP
ncbi:MAG TPA: hypothetical protein VFM14_19065 [Gemmatimonadales bacterium]|nr:hypothetical protein [Gemmatimonadales bacterium]